MSEEEAADVIAQDRDKDGATRLVRRVREM
jgi:hypothetical protein